MSKRVVQGLPCLRPLVRQHLFFEREYRSPTRDIFGMVEGGVDQVGNIQLFPLIHKVSPMVAFIEIKDQ
jgi:hypothetical protein